MPESTEEFVIKVFNKQIAPVMARLAKMELSIKHIEDTFKDVLKIAALEKEVAKQASVLNLYKDMEKRQVAFHEAQLKKSHDELVVLRGDTAKIQAAADKMEAKMAKAEMLEARLKGMEMMIKSMDQTISMLQRKR